MPVPTQEYNALTLSLSPTQTRYSLARSLSLSLSLSVASHAIFPPLSSLSLSASFSLCY